MATTNSKTHKTLLKLRNRAYSTLSIKMISEALVIMGYKVERNGRGDEARLAITAPNGMHREWIGRVADYELAGWLFKETAADAHASVALGMPSVEDEKRERENKARDWINTGTCPACFRNVKMRDGKMVLHGYERPGYGYTIGQCFGVGYEPYERSPEGTKACRAHYEEMKKHLENVVAQMSSPDFCSPLQTTKHVRWETVTVTVTREEDEHEWKRILATSIASTESQIRMIDVDIRILTEKIEEWRPGMKMPEDIARERGWLT